MRFKIQSDLKNFSKALSVLAEPNAQAYFDSDTLPLIRKQRLFKPALELFTDRPELIAKIHGDFAQYLEDRGYTLEAGQMWMSVNEIEADGRALEAFKKCHNVDLCMALAHRLDFDDE
jgi:hypothetical protein